MQIQLTFEKKNIFSKIILKIFTFVMLCNKLGGRLSNMSVTDLLQRGRDGYKNMKNYVMRFMDSPQYTKIYSKAFI